MRPQERSRIQRKESIDWDKVQLRYLYFIRLENCD